MPPDLTSPAGSNGDRIAEEALRWHARVHSGHLTVEQSRALEAWLAAAPEHLRVYRELDGIWEAAADLRVDAATGRLAPPAAWAVGRPAVARAVRPALAAVLALLLVFAGLGLWRGGHGPGLFHDMATAVGERRVIELADGSTLWLDARSAADFDAAADHRRLVLHAGRAFVQVAPDAGRPFTVAAGQATVTALGTAFAVDRGADGAVGVAVAEHGVSVRWRGHEVAQLMAARRTTVDAAGHAAPATRIARQAVGAWRHGRLVAEGLTLGQVVDRLADYRMAPILVTGAAARLRVNAVLDLDDVDAALVALQLALPIRVRGLGPLLAVVDRADR